jgi:hypothetical protein
MQLEDRAGQVKLELDERAGQLKLQLEDGAVQLKLLPKIERVSYKRKSSSAKATR